MLVMPEIIKLSLIPQMFRLQQNIHTPTTAERGCLPYELMRLWLSYLRARLDLAECRGDAERAVAVESRELGVIGAIKELHDEVLLYSSLSSVLMRSASVRISSLKTETASLLTGKII